MHFTFNIFSIMLPLLISFSVASQIPHLEVEGSSKFVGLMDVRAAFNDSTSIHIGNGVGIPTLASSQNTFMGFQAGNLNSFGILNTYVGFRTGAECNTNICSRNALFGHSVGEILKTGRNSFFGFNTGKNTTTGERNSFFGCEAGLNNTTASGNSFFGYYAGKSNGSNSGNSYFGSNSGENSSGTSNSFFGQSAGKENAGSHNSYFGRSAGNRHTSGNYNSFFGEGSGGKQGGGNSFFGSSSGTFNEADNNSFFGAVAGNQNTTGTENAFFGRRSGLGNRQGSFNTFLGYQAGINNRQGDRNICLGYNAGPSVEDSVKSDKLYIDIERTSDPLIYGEFDNNLVKVNGIFNMHNVSNSISLMRISNNSTGNSEFDGLQIGIDGDNAGRLSLMENEDLYFQTNSSTKMTLKNTGRLGIGISGPVQKFHLHEAAIASTFMRVTNGATGFSSSDGFDVGVEGGGDAIVWMKENSNLKLATNNSVRVMILNNGNIGLSENSPNVRLDVNGSIEYTGSITDVSDMRLKENIEPIEDPLSKISDLSGFTYNIIGESDRSAGVSAQDVQKVLPEAVSQINEEYLGVDYTQLVPLLLEAVKELSDKVDRQDTEILELKNLLLGRTITTEE